MVCQQNLKLRYFHLGREDYSEGLSPRIRLGTELKWLARTFLPHMAVRKLSGRLMIVSSSAKNHGIQSLRMWILQANKNTWGKDGDAT